MKKICTLFFLSSLMAINAQSQTDNLVVYRVGDGASALSSAATAVFLDEYSQAGVLVRTIPLPTGQPSGPALTASGTATTEGMINRSTNRQYLVFTGYGAPVGTTGITSSTGSSVNRIIARVNESGTVDISTTLTSFSGGNIRSATSTDGTSFWAVGSNTGVVYAQHASHTSTVVSSTSTNLRNVNIYNGQLYVSSAAGSIRLGTVGTGVPATTGQTITALPGIPTTPSVNQFVFLDLNASVPGDDVLYFADDAAGIQKYSLVGGTWVSNGGVPNSGARGIVATVAGSTVTIYTTTPTGIYRTIDLGGYNVSPTSAINTPPAPNVPSVATLLVSAPANTAFRGLAFAPIAAGGALPVKFIGFDGKRENNGIKLTWKVDVEVDAKGYEVEKSADGRTFTSIGFVNAAGLGTYSFVDNKPEVLSYYRIKGVDIDGKFRYSAVVNIKNGTSAVVFKAFPMPANKFVSIQHSKAVAGSNLSLYAENGVLVKSVKPYVNTQQTEIDLSNVKPGLYFVRYDDGQGGSESIKIIKQ